MVFVDKNQLQLIETPSNWRLDDETKEIGREGLAQARSILRATRALEASTIAVELPADRKAA